MAKVTGGGAIAGGGGDALEIRVSDIRSDILKWIDNEGARQLKLQEKTTYDDYINKMREIMKPQYVSLSFTNEKLLVGNSEKTCKGIFDEEKSRPKLTCNIDRFEKTIEADQYSLIHHEYAGLIGLEQNIGSASDYFLSSQVVGFLEEKTILKLAIKQERKNMTKVIDHKVTIDANNSNEELARIPQNLMSVFVDQGFKQKEISKNVFQLEIKNLSCYGNSRDVLYPDYSNAGLPKIECFVEKTSGLRENVKKLQESRYLQALIDVMEKNIKDFYVSDSAMGGKSFSGIPKILCKSDLNQNEMHNAFSCEITLE
jgi:hypothetical protein